MESRFDSVQEQQIFLPLKKSTRFGEPKQAPFQRIWEALYPGVKHVGRGVDHILSFTAVVKNTWS